MPAAKTILLIEDEPALRSIIAGKLSKAGFVVLEAADGKAGLALALSEVPDLILLDVLLPEMNGMTVLKQLRQDDVGQDIPVIILTSMTSTSAILQLIRNDISTAQATAENTKNTDSSLRGSMEALHMSLRSYLGYGVSDFILKHTMNWQTCIQKISRILAIHS